LNTPSIGPNLHLAKNGNPGDGQLDLVLVSATEREHFLDYLSKKIRGENVVYSGTVISAKEVKIASPAVSIHVDDRLKRYAGGEITISLRGGLLQILAPCE
jgi:diacylglycerol kinase (ATP)